MPFRRGELVGEDGGTVGIWQGVRRGRNLREFLELLAPERATKRRMPIVQTGVVAEVARSYGNFCFAVLAGRFDLVILRAQADAVCT